MKKIEFLFKCFIVTVILTSSHICLAQQLSPKESYKELDKAVGNSNWENIKKYTTDAYFLSIQENYVSGDVWKSNFINNWPKINTILDEITISNDTTAITAICDAPAIGELPVAASFILQNGNWKLNDQRFLLIIKEKIDTRILDSFKKYYNSRPGNESNQWLNAIDEILKGSLENKNSQLVDKTVKEESHPSGAQIPRGFSNQKDSLRLKEAWKNKTLVITLTDFERENFKVKGMYWEFNDFKTSKRYSIEPDGSKILRNQGDVELLEFINIDSPGYEPGDYVLQFVIAGYTLGVSFKEPIDPAAVTFKDKNGRLFEIIS